MEGSRWAIHKVEVRCPCGVSFENADKYLRHKRFCTRHRENTSVGSKPSGASQRAPIAPAEASFTIASQEPRAFFSSQSSKSSCTVRNQSPGCSARRHQMRKNLALSYPGLIQSWTPDVGSISSAARHPTSLPRSANNVDCACGRAFAKQAVLDMDLQTSKIHRAERIYQAKELITSTPTVVQAATHTASSRSSPRFGLRSLLFSMIRHLHNSAVEHYGEMGGL